MKKQIINLTLITLFAKILGLIRDIILSSIFGASKISDAYFISLIVPSVLFGFIVSGITTSFIPIYSQIIGHNKTKDKIYFTSKVINYFSIASIFLATSIFIFPEFFISIFSPGLDVETFSIAVIFTRITTLTIPFVAFSSVLIRYLQVNNIFIMSAIGVIISNITGSLFIYFASRLNITYLPLGFLFSEIIQAIILFYISFKLGYFYKFTFKFDSNMRKMIILSLPVILGNSFNQINQIFDKYIASFFSEGSISSLSYAHRIDSFVQGIFTIAINTVIFAKLSELSSNNNRAKFDKVLNSSLIIVLLLLVPSAIGIAQNSMLITEVLFFRGEFDRNDLFITQHLLFYYSIGILGVGVRSLMVRVFYSLHDTKTPLYISTFTILLNIFLTFTLTNILGINGIPISTSISSLVSIILLISIYHLKYKFIDLNKLFLSFFKILFSSMCMYFSILIFDQLIIFNNSFFNLLFNIALSSFSFFFVIILLKTEYIYNFIFESLGAFLKRTKV